MSDLSETVDLLIAAGVDPQVIEDNPESVVFISRLLDVIQHRIAEKMTEKLFSDERFTKLILQ